MMSNQSAPAATVVPILVYEDVGKAIEWLCGAFGFAERLRFEQEGVVSHAQLVVAEGAIMLGRQGGEYRAPRRGEVQQYVHVTVQDVDRHFELAKQFGAKSVPSHRGIPDQSVDFLVLQVRMATDDTLTVRADQPGRRRQ